MSSFLFLTSSAPLKEVWEPPDRPLTVSLDAGTIKGGEFDSRFSILRREPVWELATDKPYFAVLNIYRPGCEEEILKYLKDQLKTVSEIEFWHVWLDMDFGHKVRSVDIPSDTLTAEDIRELAETDIYGEPPVDFCYRIFHSGG